VIDLLQPERRIEEDELKRSVQLLDNLGLTDTEYFKAVTCWLKV
jgi:hypothetical protein